MLQPLVTVVVLTACTAALQAQGAQLIGLTRDTPVLRTQDPATCALTHRCQVQNLPSVEFPWAGGTAYDSTTGGVWVSTGRQIARLDPDTCGPQCGPFPMLDSNVAPDSPVVTGLAMSESTGNLLVINSAGTLIQLFVRGCLSPFPATRCDTGLAATNTASTTGLAVDEANRLVFISYADFATGQSKLALTRLGDPACSVFQTEELSSCGTHPLGPVTGLAVDWCEQVLWATDGRHTVALKYKINPLGTEPGLVFEPAGCCFSDIGTLADPLVGLALTPAPVRPFGEPCANGACNPCSGMIHEVRNGPTVGNPNLRFDVARAKVNKPIWLVIGLGPCAVGPQPFPLCGPLLVGVTDMRPVSLGPFWPAGNGALEPCSGRVSVPIPVPVLPGLCGSQWSSQWIQLCFEPFVYGTAMSNCVSFDLGS